MDPVTDPEASNLLAVLLLAVLQGVAEFLPISSSGHLVLGRSFLGLKEVGLAFDVALHVGTLVAVLVAYRVDVIALLRGLLRREWRLPIWLAVASIPAALLGICADDLFEQASANVRVAGWGLLGTACLLALGERGRRRHGQPSDEGVAVVPPLWTALVIGVAQAAALVPGVSRSGSTIAAGLMLGLAGTQAARLSFLMSLIAVGGAALLKLPDAMELGFGSVSNSGMLLGVVVSGLVGLLSLRMLLLFLTRHSLLPFVMYTGCMGLWILLVSNLGE